MQLVMEVNMNNSIEHSICFETCYHKSNDITFVMKKAYDDSGLIENKDGESICEEVIGFYHGEPNVQETDYYIMQYYLKLAGGKHV